MNHILHTIEQNWNQFISGVISNCIELLQTMTI